MTTQGFVLLIITWVIVGLATKDRKHTPQTANNNQNLGTIFEKQAECSLAQTINHHQNLGTVTYRWQAQPKG